MQSEFESVADNKFGVLQGCNLTKEVHGSQFCRSDSVVPGTRNCRHSEPCIRGEFDVEIPRELNGRRTDPKHLWTWIWNVPSKHMDRNIRQFRFLCLRKVVGGYLLRYSI